MLLYGVAYYPEHREEDRWQYDLDNMSDAAVNCVRVGEFAWKRFEPEEGRYAFDWMDRFIELAARRDIAVMMSAPLRTAPAWLVEKDRSILHVTSDGRRLEFGGRYTFCINHPLLRERGMALAGELARRYGSHPAVQSWHLDNEYGDESDCHCHRCRTAWRRWLSERYGDINHLNRIWGTVFWGLEFDSFSQVPTPRPTHALLNPALWQAWRQFRSDTTAGVIGLHARAVRPHVGEKPVTTNFQTLWNNHTDYFHAARHLDVCGLNYYPGFGENCRDRQLGLAVVRGCKRKNFWVLETHPSAIHFPGADSPQDGELARLCLHQVANGVDGILFFRWRVSPFGAEQHIMSVTGYDGRPRRNWEEFRQVGRRLRRLAPVIEGMQVRSEAAVFYDFQSRWYTETSRASPAAPWAVRGDRQLYLERAKMLYNALRDQHVNVDAVGRQSDLEPYRLIVVPMLITIGDELAEKFAAFVESGGTLLWHAYSGFADMETSIFPRRLHPVMEKLLGIEVSEFATSPPGVNREFVWNGKTYEGALFHDLPVLDGARTLAAYSGWMDGMPAVTVRRTGRGRAVHVGTFASAGFYADFLAALLNEAGVETPAAVRAPACLEVAALSDDEGREVTFVLSTSSKPERFTIPRPMKDLWSERTLSGEVELEPFGVCVLQ